jgi:hypothetical protein
VPHPSLGEKSPGLHESLKASFNSARKQGFFADSRVKERWMQAETFLISSELCLAFRGINAAFAEGFFDGMLSFIPSCF